MRNTDFGGVMVERRLADQFGVSFTSMKIGTIINTVLIIVALGMSMYYFGVNKMPEAFYMLALAYFLKFEP